MTLALTLLVLGVLTQAMVLAQSKPTLSRFNHVCLTCGYHIPPMEYTPAFYDCPECDRLFTAVRQYAQKRREIL